MLEWYLTAYQKRTANANWLRRQKYVRCAISHLDKESHMTSLILPPRSRQQLDCVPVNIKDFPAFICLCLRGRQTVVSVPRKTPHCQNTPFSPRQWQWLRLGGGETSVLVSLLGVIKWSLRSWFIDSFPLETGCIAYPIPR